MHPRLASPRQLATVLAVLVIAIAVALPVLAATPAPSGAPAASGGGPEPRAGKAPKAAKEAKAPEVKVTLRGVVGSTIGANGRTEFTLLANGKTLKLSAGPPWFFGAKHPLLPFVGKTVTIVGEQSGDELDVDSVDGTALRSPGKPPWAGGWKAVGKVHPGWSQAKADRQAAKAIAKAAARAACAASAASSTCSGDEPDESEAPEASEKPAGG